MFGNHVSSLSSAYFDGELNLGESNRVAEHLLVCPKCRAEFETVKSGVRIGEQIQIVAAPDSLWTGIAVALDDRGAKPARLWMLKPVMVAVAVIFVLGAALWLLTDRTPQGEWNVARLGGSPRINSQVIGEAGKLGVGQLLETDSTSRAHIDVAAIGSVEIDPNSSV